MESPPNLKKQSKFFVATLVAWLLAVPSAQAMTILDPPVVSGSVIDIDADGFDSTDPVMLRPGYVDNNIIRNIRRGVIEFDLSLLPPGGPTDSFVLSAFQASLVANGGGPLQVRGYAGNGTLDLSDATQTGPVLGTYNDLLNTTMMIDVSGFVNGLIAQGERYAGFEFRGTEEARHGVGGFNINAASRLFVSPRLTVTVPEPSTALLVVLGSILLAASTRRRL